MPGLGSALGPPHGFVSSQFSSGFPLVLSPVLDWLGTKPFWQRASSWQLAKHDKEQNWWTPSSSQSHPRHRGGGIMITPRQLTWCTNNGYHAQDQAPRSKLKYNGPSPPPTFLWRRCAGTVPHTSARDFRLAAESVFVWRVCVFLRVVECPTAKMLVYRPY